MVGLVFTGHSYGIMLGARQICLSLHLGVTASRAHVVFGSQAHVNLVSLAHVEGWIRGRCGTLGKLRQVFRGSRRRM